MNQCLVLDKKHYSDLTKNLIKEFNVNSLTYYCPIIDNFLNESDNEENNYIFKSKYFIYQLEDKISDIENKQSTPYIKRIFNAKVKNNYNNKIVEKTVFVKVNPILDVVSYILEQYDTDTTLLPNYKQNFTSDYINNFNNTAYIDAFFSLLASKLTDSGKAPCFPLYYGTLSCTLNDYKYDITEEYSKIKYQDKYQQNINKLFTIFEVDIDSDVEYDSDSYTDYSRSNNSSQSCGSDFNLNIDELPNLQINNQYEINVLAHKRNTELDNENEELDSLNLTEINNDHCFNEIIDDNRTFKYCCLNNYPVQLLFIENLSYTLDDLIDNEDYTITQDEWKSILFQICFGLAVVQKAYKFCHNDLHSQNIMFVPTDEDFLYYEFNSKYFKIPTFGKIVKIIDFGRATFIYNNVIYFSSVFDEYGDANGQYDYPEDNSFKYCKVKPNPSFDLSRLSSTIIEHFHHKTQVYKLLKSWLIDKYGNNLQEHEDNFDLYIKIAKNMTNAVPSKQLTKNIFKIFYTTKKKINSKKFIFRY